MYQTTILRRVRELRLLHSVSLELTYQCNLNCFYCYNDRQKTGRPLSFAQYRVLLRDLAGMQTMFVMLTGGEPMLHPHFFEIGRLTRELGFVVRVRTNGHALAKKAARRLINEVQPYAVEVSLHGATAEIHDRQTRVRGSFDRLIANIKTAKDLGLRCEFVTTPTAWNEHQIEDMFTLCNSLDTPLKFQGPVGPRDNGDTAPLAIQPARKTWDLITELQKKRRDTSLVVEQTDEKIPPAVDDNISEEPAMCSVGVSGVDIDPFGNVQACMHLQESAGNVHEQSIKEIWEKSPLFLRARARAIEAARQFVGKPPSQYGAPLFCIAVEENAQKQKFRQCRGVRR
jgi:MoaA/NifB/PqqE/SkfB family radical SAM enzyme